MKNKSHILRFRKHRREKDRSNPLGTIGFLLAALLSIVISAAIIYGVSRYAEITNGLPSPAALERLLHPNAGSLLEPTRIMDRSGERTLWQFENAAIEYRRYSPITDGDTIFYSNVSEDMIQATLAAVDPDYFQRPSTFLAGILSDEEDPIPESLAADLLLWGELDHPFFQIRLGLLSDQIIAAYGRYQVLEWYLNSAYYGYQLYGIAQASEYYFGKQASDLNLEESALLAAVGRFPALNPQDAPIAARENQVDVLDQMVEVGFITSDEADLAARNRLVYANQDQEGSPPQPGFVPYLLNEAEETIPLQRLLRGGLKIISTLDSDLQDALDCTLETMRLRVYGQSPQLRADCEIARLLPKYSGLELDEGDALEMDLVVYDPLSGELLGLAGLSGGGDPPRLDNPRDPGSLITPYLYLNAFRQGFEPASLVWDIPLPDSGFSPDNLHPGGGGEEKFLGPVNIRTALVNDLLSPAQQLLEAQGLPQFLNTLRLFGFTIPDGEGSVSDHQKLPELEMIDLVQGFGVFVNLGTLKGRVVDQAGLEVQPAGIQWIEDLAGSQYVPDQMLHEKKIISEELAYLVNHVLSDQEAWLDSRIADTFRIGRPVGVKTGQTQNGSSGWVIGYTPQIVVGAWTGADELAVGFDPVGISASLWRAVTQHASREHSAGDWEMPPGVITADVCYPSGDLPTDYCPRIVREVFIQGNEPFGLDGLYQALDVNRETGLLASVFTPAGQIEQRVYLDVPPLAEPWAESVGIKTPPELYDLQVDSQDNSSLRITTPENLSFVRGRVRIKGSIPEDGFVSARLQFGAGLNPRSWLQIGEEITSPAEDRTLGFWETSDLAEGIYALQLVVILENQEIQTRSLILSVDNSAPDMILITDLSGGEISSEVGEDLYLEVRFPNPSEIEVVEFFLDGELLATRRIGPYIVPWRMVPGTHILEVRAQDQAGNRSELSQEFHVIRN